MQRIALAITTIACLAVGVFTTNAMAQPAPTTDIEEIQPLLPPGISDFDVELYGRLAYTWSDGDTRIIEIQGDFTARMGQYKLAAKDAVIWHTDRQWQDKHYLDLEIFLWQGAEVIQPAGTVETGPVLIATLRSFGKLLLNADSVARNVTDADSALYQEGLRARGLLDATPTPRPDQAEAPIHRARTLDELRLALPKPPRKVEFSVDPETGHLAHQQYDGRSVIIATGNVAIAQGSSANSGEYVELRADAAVLFLNADQVGDAIPGLLGSPEEPKKRRRADSLDDVPLAPPDAAEPLATDDDVSQRRAIREWISAAYLEGDVVLTRGRRMIRATKLYYDFDAEKALILDVVTRIVEPTRGLPIYVRADEVRQLSATEYEATDALISTSEFHTPHVAIGARKVYLKDRTPRNERGEIIGVEAGTYKAYHTAFTLEGIPIAYWPFSRGDFSRDRMAFRSAKFGYHSDFGVTTETRWHFFNLLGLQQPEGYDATLKIDYFTDRGPGTGIDMDYEQEDYLGLLRTYYIHDDGEDDLGGGRGGEPETKNRGRALWRHRQYLPRDWELSLEAAYVSDDDFLEAFERSEWENGKDQETAIYLVKRDKNWQFSFLANWKINDFLTKTEHLPDVMFSVVGEPIGDFATWYHESRAGFVRYRPDNRRWLNGQTRADNDGETGTVGRGDLREELLFPLPEIGPLKLTPYVMARGTAWDDSPDSQDGGGTQRYFGAYGLRGNMIFSKVDDSIESQLLDLHRLRHVIKADVHAWNAHTNRAPNNLSPFDAGVEDIDDFGGAVLGLRQRFQTKRGGPGRWRSVDWITLDIEAGFFNDAQSGERTHGDFIAHRPEDSISSNFLSVDFQYRLSDTTVFVYDGVYDWNRNNVGTSNVSIAVEREPRLAYFVGWRYIHDTGSNLIGGGANYKLNEKHTLAIREYYDIERGKNYTTELIYVRRWPRWYTAVAMDIDRSLEDIGVNISIWPEGAPRMGLGSKRYTGLSDSVGLRLR